jgi:hypothetical protein
MLARAEEEAAAAADGDAKQRAVANARMDLFLLGAL